MRAIWVMPLLAMVCSYALGSNYFYTRQFAMMCDASSIFQVEPGTISVLDDESNQFFTYDVQSGSKPIAITNIFVDGKFRAKEADFEASTRTGSLGVFVASHGRNKKGNIRKSRHVIALVDFNTGSNRLYRNLIEDVLNDSRYLDLGFYESTRPDKKQDKNLAPKKNGFNIEGASFDKDNNTLWLGLRNHKYSEKAIIFGIKNILDVFYNGSRAEFTAPILIDLNGNGIRSMEYIPELSKVLIVAGPIGDRGRYYLYEMDDFTGSGLRQLSKISHMGNVEGLHFNKETFSLFFVSDDGTREIGGRPCKDLVEDNYKFFRAHEIPINIL